MKWRVEWLKVLVEAGVFPMGATFVFPVVALVVGDG
jgi:hypothetical protein